MRTIAAMMLAVFPMLAGDLKIDHATVAGADLEAMRRALAKAAGIVTEYGGPHANHATEMALASFPDGSYLELIAIQPKAEAPAVSAHAWSKFLRDNAGPCAFALRVEDTKAEAARLKAAGIAVSEPQRSGRTRPDGTRLDWETIDLGAGRHGSFFPFLIRDLTPRKNRVYPGGKPTTDRFRGVGKVVIGVADLGGTIAQYRRAFGLPEPRRQSDAAFEATLAWFEGTPVVLAQALTGTSWLGRRVKEYGDAPCAFILTASGGLIGARRSDWFGTPVFWTEEAKLGWRLGMEVGAEEVY